jgi:hypothetical protein
MCGRRVTPAAPPPGSTEGCTHDQTAVEAAEIECPCGPRSRVERAIALALVAAVVLFLCWQLVPHRRVLHALSIGVNQGAVYALVALGLHAGLRHHRADQLLARRPVHAVVRAGGLRRWSAGSAATESPR